MKISVKINDQTFEVSVGDLQDRPILAVIDGETFEVYPEEGQALAAAPAPVVRPAPVAAPAPAPAPAPVRRPAEAPVAGDRAHQVVAPIPGTILAVSVHEGQDVNPGQELCTLEAMKMKSAIKANRAGKIAKIRIAAGDKVAQNQALMDYAD